MNLQRCSLDIPLVALSPLDIKEESCVTYVAHVSASVLSEVTGT